MLKLKKLVKTTLTPIALCLTLAIAIPAIAKKGHYGKHDGMRQMLSELSLTSAQKQDIKQILKQSREDRGLFSSDAQSLETELLSLVQSSAWDQAAVENVITQRHALTQQKTLQRATNRNQVWNLLTDTQQAEFVEQLETRKAKYQKMASEGKRKDKRKGKKLKRLGLTEAQLTAVEAIETAAKVNNAETKEKLKAYKAAERGLIHSAEFNAEAWQTLNSEYQVDFLANAMLKAKTQYDIWNQLTPEQQTKLQARNEKRSKGKKWAKHNKQDV